MRGRYHGEEKSKNVLLGERDEKGQYKVPHTCYGLVSNVKFIFGKMWQYQKILFPLFVIGAITQSIICFFGSYISKYLVEIVETQTKMQSHDISPLIQLIVVVALVGIVVIGGNALVSNRVYYKMCFLRFQIITEKNEKLLSLDYQTLEKPHILDLYQRVGNAVSGNWQGVEGMMRRSYLLSAYAVTLIVTATTIIVLDPRLILVLTLAMIINYLSQRWSYHDDKKYFWDATSTTRRRISYMERCTQDFDYAKDIRLFSLKPWLLKKQRDILDDYQKKYNKGRSVWLRHSFIYSGTTLISASVMFYILISQVLHESVSIGDYTLYLGLCAAFSSALSDFYDNFGLIQYSSNMVDDYRTFMDMEMEKEEDCLDISVLGDAYHFEFRNVCFRYEGTEADTIKNLNLTFPAGQRLAVVGLNGAGKTTFIKLALRLYDPTAGEILVNGYNIKRFKRTEYYRLFAPVFQNVELFAFPLSENVSMKEPEETDKEKALECLIRAGMEQKVNSLEKGIDTEVLKVLYDDGVDFSGGERQKLALARALYKDAPVIVLDEPTAALDALAEYELYQNFDKMVEGKSAIYISHRLSSTRFCDVIAMFMDGRIVEYGTHEELLAKDGEYAKMFRVQAQYYENNREGGECNEESRVSCS